jgi:hypothetical protein
MATKPTEIDIYIDTNVKFKEHNWDMVGGWYTLDHCDRDGIRYYLLEHAEWGDERPHIIIDEFHNIIVEESYNGLEELDY